MFNLDLPFGLQQLLFPNGVGGAPNYLVPGAAQSPVSQDQLSQLLPFLGGIPTEGRRDRVTNPVPPEMMPQLPTLPGMPGISNLYERYRSPTQGDWGATPESMGQQPQPAAGAMPSWAQSPGDAANALNLPSGSYQQGQTSVPVFGQAPQSNMLAYRQAIQNNESGGDYSSVGQPNQKGQKPYGAYQIMDFNVGPWTKEVLGKEMTPKEFLANKDAQDAVFDAKFGNYVSKFGPEGAAKAWFAGEKGMNNPNAKDVLGTSVQAYADKFNAGLSSDVTAAKRSQPASTGGLLGNLPAPAEQNAGDRMKAALGGFIENAHTGPLGAILGAIGGGMTGQYGDQGKRAMYSAVLQATGDKNKALLAANNAEAGKYILSEIYGEKKPYGTIEVGGVKVPIADASGKLVTPQGMSLGDLQQLDAESKRRNASAEATGKSQGEAAAVLPNTLAKADETLGMIDKVRNHPGRGQATAVLGSNPGLPGTKGRDFVAMVDQLKGRTFLEAYQALKGAGAISEMEGKKAEGAIARLDRSQSKEAFDEALNDLEGVIRTGRNNAGVIAGGKPTPAPAGWHIVAPGIRIRERQ